MSIPHPWYKYKAKPYLTNHDATGIKRLSKMRRCQMSSPAFNAHDPSKKLFPNKKLAIGTPKCKDSFPATTNKHLNLEKSCAIQNRICWLG